jgi:hypothetical protein
MVLGLFLLSVIALEMILRRSPLSAPQTPNIKTRAYSKEPLATTQDLLSLADAVGRSDSPLAAQREAVEKAPASRLE